MELKGSGRPILALAVGIGIQFAALVSAWGAVALVLVNSWSSLGDHHGSRWVVLTPAFVLLAVALWVASGVAASRIARDGRFWRVMLAGPILIVGTVLGFSTS